MISHDGGDVDVWYIRYGVGVLMETDELDLPTYPKEIEAWDGVVPYHSSQYLIPQYTLLPPSLPLVSLLPTHYAHSSHPYHPKSNQFPRRSAHPTLKS